MDKIVDNLYLGDIRAAANLFLLKQHVSINKQKIGYSQRMDQLDLLDTLVLHHLIFCKLSLSIGCYSYFASFIRTQSMFSVSK